MQQKAVYFPIFNSLRLQRQKRGGPSLRGKALVIIKKSGKILATHLITKRTNSD